MFSLWILPFSLFFFQSAWAEAKEEGRPKAGGTYRKPLEFSPRTLDPALATDIYSFAIIQQLFDGLVQFDKNLNVVPAIAKSWKVSPDGLTYTFYLREGVKFHNGREVTAEDWVYSITRIIDSKTASPASTFLDRVLGSQEFREGKAPGVKGLTSPGKHVFEIRLSEPYAPFLSVLGMINVKVLPSEEVEKSGTSFGKTPVGTGPFRFVSMKEGEEIILDANESYFEGGPYLREVIFKIFHGAPRKKIFKEFQDGNLEETFVSPEMLEDVLREKRYLFFQKPILSLRFYGFNLSSKPLDNRDLRKAINFAIDKNSIISEIHKNQFQLARSILPPGMPGYDPRKDPYPFDPTRASGFLSKAGFSKERHVPPLEIWSASDSEAAQKELNEIRLELSRIGIESSIHFETNWPKFASWLADHKLPVFLRAWYADFPDPDNFLGTLFHSRSKYNYMAYHNPNVDHLLDQARKETDYLKRIELYRKIEEVVLEDAPIVPMVHPLLQIFCQPYVRGLEVNALGASYIPMKKIWLDKD